MGLKFGKLPQKSEELAALHTEKITNKVFIHSTYCTEVKHLVVF